MRKTPNFQPEPELPPNQLEQKGFAEVPAFVASPFQGTQGDASLAPSVPTCVRLDMEELQCFEVVDRQFQEQGVTFSNAIALIPSNPAFPPRSGMKVLMGAPKEGWVEATFSNPVKFVGGYVTSSRRTVLAAFDDQDQPVARTESRGGNLAGSNSPTPPNVQLCLQGQNIRRVTFHTFDGQLTLDDFMFAY